MPKRERSRLAKAELLMHLAMTVEDWSKSLADANPGTRPVVEWPDNDPLVALCRTYRLTPADLSRLCHRLGDELENRAERAGYADHLDSV